MRTFHYGQKRLIFDQSVRDHVLVAGVGYGKSFLGPPWLLKRIQDNPKSKEFLVIAPDNKLLKTQCLERTLEFLDSVGLSVGRSEAVSLNKSDLVLTFNATNQKIFFLTAEAANKIIGYTVAAAWVDEAARCNEQARRNLIKRLRCPNAATKRQILSTTTPEGVNWFFDRFGPNKARRVPGTAYSEGPGILVLHGSSYDNPYLDDDFFSGLKDEFGFDEAYFKNYVLGEWVSLSKNRFYFTFTDENIISKPPDYDNKTLFFTFDNNVGKLAWSALQIEQERAFVVKSNNSDGRTLGECVEQILDAFPPAIWGSHLVHLYGDATLHHRSIQSYDTGFDILSRPLKHFYPSLEVKAHLGNPHVEERMFVTNRLFGSSRLYVDASCQSVITSARTAETDGAKGIKKTQNDNITHAMEAVDMALVNLFPRRSASEIRGVNLQ